MTLSPVSPSPYQGEGEDFEKRGEAPLKHPHIINPEQGERYKRRVKERRSLSKISSPSPFKERGTQGVRSVKYLKPFDRIAAGEYTTSSSVAHGGLL